MSLSEVTRDSRDMYSSMTQNRSHKPIVHETTGISPSERRRRVMRLGEKLPALINASLTLVPGDGIYCFGTPRRSHQDTNLQQQVASIATSMTVLHP